MSDLYEVGDIVDMRSGWPGKNYMYAVTRTHGDDIYDCVNLFSGERFSRHKWGGGGGHERFEGELSERLSVNYAMIMMGLELDPSNTEEVD